MGFYAAKRDIYNIGIVDNDKGILTVAAANDTTTLKSINGTGVFYWAIFKVSAKADCQGIEPILTLDGYDVIPEWGFYYWYNQDITATSSPVRLLQYGVDAICCLEVFYPNGLPFNTNFTMAVDNPIADTFQITWNKVNTLMQ